jgi:ribonuclease T2
MTMIDRMSAHPLSLPTKLARAVRWFSDRAAWHTTRLGLALGIMCWATPAHAADFTPTRAESAVAQPSSRKSVGQLVVGTSYRLLKVGGPAGGWCKLQLPQGAGWVLCSAGTQSDSTSASPIVRPTTERTETAPRGPTSGFDYYLLSLSWSPTFCASKGDSAPEQCGINKHYGFVVHGLWPQGESGRNPMSCASSFQLAPGLVQQTLSFMPSQHLIEHEWGKHGTCSGLSPEDYFATARRAYQSIHIPAELQLPKQPVSATLEEIEGKFITANPGLSADMIAVQCHGSVSEIRFCLDKDLKPRHCGHGVGDSCRGRAVFPPSR